MMRLLGKRVRGLCFAALCWAVLIGCRAGEEVLGDGVEGRGALAVPESADAVVLNNLIVNGDFAEDGGDGWPRGWGRHEGVSWLSEGNSRFMRVESVGPDKMYSIYRRVDLPEGMRAAKLSWRWRVTGLVNGEKSWHDTRIIVNFLDGAGSKVSGPAPNRGSDSQGWETRSITFLVPEDTVSIEIMPSLFHAKEGIMDITHISLTPADPTPLLEKKRIKEEMEASLRMEPEKPVEKNWPPELKVAVNKIVDPENNEVWLQGVNIPSLEWSLRGDNVMKSAVVAVDEWKANAVRLCMKDDFWFGEEAEQYRRLIDNVIILVANRGAYVILDLHRYRAIREEHIKFWEDAAARYKNHPAVLFDIINEPHGISWEVWRNGGFVEERTGYANEDAFLEEEDLLVARQGFSSPGMQAAVNRIRATGARNIIVAGALDWAYDLSGILKGFALDDPSGNGIVYSSHVYPWKNNWQESFIAVAEFYPVILGEVGCMPDPMPFQASTEDPHTWAPDILGVIRRHNLHWTAWCFHTSASPRILLDWNYTPTPYWGQYVKDALTGDHK